MKLDPFLQKRHRPDPDQVIKSKAVAKDLEEHVDEDVQHVLEEKEEKLFRPTAGPQIREPGEHGAEPSKPVRGKIVELDGDQDAIARDEDTFSPMTGS